MKKLAIFAVLASLSIVSVTFAQTVTGDVDPNGDSSCVDLQNNLRLGSRDSSTNGEVSILQDFLNTEGHLNVSPTGYFGRSTLAAAKSFQSANGLLSSGYVGPITRAKIKELTCNGNGGTKPTTPTPTPVSGSFRVDKISDMGVRATFSLGSSCSSYTLDWGDGNNSNFTLPDYIACSQVVPTQPFTKDHMYAKAGTYTVKFQTGGNPQQSVSITIGNSLSCPNGLPPTGDGCMRTCPDGTTVVGSQTCPNTKSVYAASAEIVGSQSSYTPGQTINFSVKGISSDGTVAGPEKGFHVQAHMIDSVNWDPTTFQTTVVNGVYQSVNATYNYTTKMWDVVMTAPADNSKNRKITATFYCSNSSLGCKLTPTSLQTPNGQIEKSFTFVVGNSVCPNGLPPTGDGCMRTCPDGTMVVGNQICPSPFLKINVTYPNGGEQLVLNSNKEFRVTWTTTGNISDRVYVGIKNASTNQSCLLGYNLGNSGGMSFVLDQNFKCIDTTYSAIQPGNYYITLKTDGLSSDESDAPFTFLSSVTPSTCPNGLPPTGDGCMRTCPDGTMVVGNQICPTIPQTVPQFGVSPSIVSVTGTSPNYTVKGSNLSSVTNIEFINSSGQLTSSLSVPSITSVLSDAVNFTMPESFFANVPGGTYQVRVVSNSCPGGCNSNTVPFFFFNLKPATTTLNNPPITPLSLMPPFQNGLETRNLGEIKAGDFSGNNFIFVPFTLTFTISSKTSPNTFLDTVKAPGSRAMGNMIVNIYGPDNYTKMYGPVSHIPLGFLKPGAYKMQFIRGDTNNIPMELVYQLNGGSPSASVPFQVLASSVRALEQNYAQATGGTITLSAPASIATATEIMNFTGLARGANEARVSRLKSILNTISPSVSAGCVNLSTANTLFGPTTEECVKVFQKLNELEPTGAVNEATNKALNSVITR